ncbi:hypothetical protein DK880_00144 [Candidatus Cardinium hertigii]|uniref:Uncharacterized protein n=1 Tax=Candidatus Cardinium hertigii TaxID=247481 RepID=A0A2Z3LHF5_9BACT|nr:hypothetical protein DK880_00144 [Candidatus Cardinium hertigii]
MAMAKKQYNVGLFRGYLPYTPIKARNQNKLLCYIGKRLMSTKKC